MKIFSSLALCAICHLVVHASAARISPKLDFGEASEVIEVNKEIKSAKIKGLRVTVDTSELKESKSSGSESSSSGDSGEKKKTVGVRTDVTFEITSGETNDTKTVDEKEIGKDDDNASIPIVPVFKGTPDRTGSGGSTGGGGKDPNFNDIWSVRPLDGPAATPSGPNFHRNNDDRNFYGGGGAPGGGDNSWNKQYPQFAIWTTERYNRRPDQPVFHHRGQYDIYRKPSNFIPYNVHQQQQPHHNHHQHQPWQPCHCREYPGPFIKPQQPSSDEQQQHQRVDDKLERPFSKTSS